VRKRQEFQENCVDYGLKRKALPWIDSKRKNGWKGLRNLNQNTNLATY
jgi:hypothetical protein